MGLWDVSERLPVLYRKLLGLVYSLQLKGDRVDVQALSQALEVEQGYAEEKCRSLEAKGLLRKQEGAYSLTETGRREIRIVMVGGVFDVIHPGHLHVLQEAGKLGDVLVVSVARDVTAVKMKGRRPFNEESRRVSLVASLRPVDAALLGSERDIYETVVKVKPDIIALGYDQGHDEREVAEEVKRRGLNVKVLRIRSYVPEAKTSAILKDQGVIKEF